MSQTLEIPFELLNWVLQSLLKVFIVLTRPHLLFSLLLIPVTPRQQELVPLNGLYIYRDIAHQSHYPH